MFLPTNSLSADLGHNNKLPNYAIYIKKWLISNNIHLNTSKTRVSVFGHGYLPNTDTPIIYGIKRLNKILKSQ